MAPLSLSSCPPYERRFRPAIQLLNVVMSWRRSCPCAYRKRDELRRIATRIVLTALLRRNCKLNAVPDAGPVIKTEILHAHDRGVLRGFDGWMPPILPFPRRARLREPPQQAQSSAGIRAIRWVRRRSSSGERNTSSPRRATHPDPGRAPSLYNALASTPGSPGREDGRAATVPSAPCGLC